MVSAGQGESGHRSFSRHWWGVWLALSLYVISFAAFYPVVITISDEGSYMRQASAFAQGKVLVSEQDPLSGQSREVLPSDYPPGTSALMAPLMALGGWRAGFLLGMASLCCVVLLSGWWLAHEGRSPLFALLVLVYPPALVLSRCGMSELPSAALVTLGLVLFWRGAGRSVWYWACAGFIAGVSVLLRETNPLLFAVFFLGALWRREKNLWALILGGLLGVACRPLVDALLFGDWAFVKPSHPGFSFLAVPENFVFYAVALLVFVPGGALWAAFYRGPRRPELLLTLAAFLILHLCYNYNASASGGLRQWVLVPRFLVPMLPLVAFAASESLPRLWAGALARLDVSARVAAQRAPQFIAVMLVLVCGAEAALVNRQHGQWANGERAVAAVLYAGTESNVPVATNLNATAKFFNELYVPEFGPRRVLEFRDLSDARAAELVQRHGSFVVALLRRTDSEYWLEHARSNEAKLKEFGARLSVRPISTAEPTPGQTVAFYRVSAP